MRIVRWLGSHVADVIALGFLIVGLVEIWNTTPVAPRYQSVLVDLFATLPVFLRRRFPFVAPLFLFASVAAMAEVAPAAVLNGPSGTQFMLMLAFWIAGAQNGRQQAIAGALVGFAALTVIAQSAGQTWMVETGDASLEIIPFGVLGAGLTLGAYVLQRRAARTVGLEERAAGLEREREERARAAVAEERARIARELHDVVAHSVSVMTVQAGAARLLLDEDPERARGPLLSVEETGRQALAEMRRLLGILRHDDGGPTLAPQPGMADLSALVEQARTAGLPVELTVEGDEAPLAPGVDLAAYRIVQEALTNARKHAVAGRAQVAVRYRRQALELEIVNDGAARRGDGSGHGLVGMRERVALYGGDLDAGPRPGGGYAVRARLPLESRA